MKRVRTKQLTYALRERLEAMAAYGESKRSYKIKTLELRRKRRIELISRKVPHEVIEKELLHIDAAKDKIFSYNTMTSYIRFVKDFAEFIKTQTGTSRTPIGDSVRYIQPYIDHLINNGDSPNTINLKLSAVCKAVGVFVVDYSHPIRRYSEVTRSVNSAKRDHFNDHRAKDSLRLNRAVGFRRTELGRIDLTDITRYSDHAVIRSVGKGGKHNETYIADPKKLAVLDEYIAEAKREGRTTLLSKEQMNHDADLHHARALCAVDEYNRVVEDMKAHPERRAYYKKFVTDFFKRHNKRLTEDLDKPYHLRGKGKALLKHQGRETVFDRVAVLYVSVTILHHYRSDTTVQHYLIK